MKKFECIKCAKCCRTLSKEEVMVSHSPHFLENGPTIIYSPRGLNMFGWEKHIFPQKNVIPADIFFDIKNKRTIVMNYTLNTISCPLLDKNNRCINYEKRPVDCRRFPCPIRDVDDLIVEKNMLVSSGFCSAELSPEEICNEIGFASEGASLKFERTGEKNISVRLRLAEDNEKQTRLILEKLREIFFRRYGYAFLYSIAKEILINQLLDFLKGLEDRGEIKLTREGYPMEYLLRRIEKGPMIDISELYCQYTNDYSIRDSFSIENIETIRKMLSL